MIVLYKTLILLIIALISSSAFTLNPEFHSDLIEYANDFHRQYFNEILANRYDLFYSLYVFSFSKFLSFKIFHFFTIFLLLIIKIYNYKYKVTFLFIYFFTYFNNFELMHLKAAIASSLILLVFNTDNHHLKLLLSASLFHISAFIYPALYFLRRNYKRIIFLFIIGILLSYFYRDYFYLRLSRYIEVESFHFQLRSLFCIAIVFIFRNKFLDAKYFIIIIAPCIFYLIFIYVFKTISQRVLFLSLPAIISVLINNIYTDKKRVISLLLVLSELLNFNYHY